MEAAAVDSSAGGGIPVSMMQNRHLPRRIDPTGHRRRSFNHMVRANAKRLAQGNDANVCVSLGLPCTASDQTSSILAGSAFRSHLEADLRQHYNAARPSPRLRCRTRPTSFLGPQEEDEARVLARSELPLPSDRFRLVRRPTLEREEAFRDASTAKSKIRVRRSAPSAGDGETEDAQVAELYRMGLLYDDADGPRAADDDATFNLNSIRHEQPVYSIRPARRPRKALSSKPAAGTTSALGTSERPLPLDLSFTDLGDDTAIAQFLSPAPSPHQLEVLAEETIQHGSLPPSRQSFPPLRVVYELASAQPSYDVDTSQPPDLVTDSLSDYDCFSDCELDDDDDAAAPSRRGVRADERETAQQHHHHRQNSNDEGWVMLGNVS
ncbi:hypothetical protein RJ55_07473 [Drechmeria coniospora]|nr:hypothetical protein RJ55_07473 [Drechmeria coniospora]